MFEHAPPGASQRADAVRLYTIPSCKPSQRCCTNITSPLVQHCHVYVLIHTRQRSLATSMHASPMHDSPTCMHATHPRNIAVSMSLPVFQRVCVCACVRARAHMGTRRPSRWCTLQAPHRHRPRPLGFHRHRPRPLGFRVSGFIDLGL